MENYSAKHHFMIDRVKNTASTGGDEAYNRAARRRRSMVALALLGHSHVRRNLHADWL